MSGHSKWSSIKRAKGVTDARRGAQFTKLTREIIIATRQGGPSPEGNFRLRLAVQKAREANMPKDNIENAIKKGSGVGEGATLTEMVMEGYGPAGVAIMVEAMTDNHNRTVAEIRSTFMKYNGNLGENGSVAWMFDNTGVITVDTEGIDPDEFALTAIDAGAKDAKEDKGSLEIYTDPKDFETVRLAIEKRKKIISAEVTMLPKNTISLPEKESLQTVKLIDKLEDLDDVQHVYSNLDYSDALIEKLNSEA
ncbi:MAG: YebC/PmpR family DNA-binding transcriptional regulator [Dehalococcoidia bacterium]|nr:YebC/PmpR family DNA-binding transcriptional regulator [Dehalococcoidia bacterium]